MSANDEQTVVVSKLADDLDEVVAKTARNLDAAQDAPWITPDQAKALADAASELRYYHHPHAKTVYLNPGETTYIVGEREAILRTSLFEHDELQAMAFCERAIHNLDPDAARRVARWFVDFAQADR